MNRPWKIREVPEEAFSALEKETNIPKLLLRLMWNRGLRDSASIERFFDPRSRHISSPFFLEGVFKAVDRIFKAFENDENIRVFGDRDVDGITSTVLLLETLRGFTKKVDFTIPVIEDGYGLNPDYIDAAKRDGVNLIITVDCGISNLKEVDYAKSLGIDVIITDHHEPPANLPNSVAIIDPKLSDSNFPFKDLAGVGVSLKLAMALVVASSKALSKPLVGMDFLNNEIDAVRFHPREGFSNLKQINQSLFSGSTILFWDLNEKKVISELLPFIEKTSNAVFVSDLAANFVSDSSNLSKEKVIADLNIPSGLSGSRKLVFLYLKYLEAIEPAIQALWQRSLDVLTIGTIADMVPMKGENRTIAQLGLKFITNTKRMGLSALFPLLGWHKKSISERDVSFGIAPILNSSGRLKSAELAIELLTTEFPPKSSALAQELYSLNIERKKLAEECYKQIREFLLEQNDPVQDKILLVYAPKPNQGVTGIVATRLMLEFCRPVFVLLEDHGKLLGSGRSYQGISIMNALHYCSEVLEKYGGHTGAAGLTLPLENLEAFRKKLREYAATNISAKDLATEWFVDSELSIDQIEDEFLKDIMKFSPFGIENPPPLFVAENVNFYEIKKVGEAKNHLRFRFKKSSGQSVFGIGFGLGKLMNAETLNGGSCDIVFTLEANDYNGVRSPQVVVHDLSIHEPVPCAREN